jgi:hypothetical protein
MGEIWERDGYCLGNELEQMGKRWAMGKYWDFGEKMGKYGQFIAGRLWKNTWEANDRQAVPSGKRLHNYGKSPFFYGKIHYFYGHFPYIFVCLPGRVPSGPKRWETPSQQDTLEITGMRASPIHIHFGLEDSKGASLFQLYGLRARSS